jgi:hypothetical protein
MRTTLYSAALAVLALAGNLAGASANPRTYDGHPNLNGIWQTLSTANWDLEDHPAAPGPFFQLGAVGAVPSGQGVVEGGEIPYKPEALKQKEANFKNRWKEDPETLVGPGYVDTDFGVLKSTRISERFNLQFRAELFNIFNHPNFGVPNETAFNADSFTTNFAATPNATAGQITSIIGNARQTQFSLKLIF